MLTKEVKREQVRRELLLIYLISFVIAAPVTIGYLFFYNCEKALICGFITYCFVSALINFFYQLKQAFGPVKNW